MPRLKGYRERFQHDFAWTVWLEPEDTCWLFARPETLRPNAKIPVLACGTDHYASFGVDMIVIDVAASRPDCVVKLRIESGEVTFSGPWMVDSAIALHQFLSIYNDALEEIRSGKRKTHQDAVMILGELIRKSKWSGVFQPGLQRARQPTSLDVRLLPNASAGYVTVSMRVLFTIEHPVDPPPTT